jgi:alginate O-acetyltransferase complex protein AlgI
MAWAPIQHIYTLVVVLVGWVFFRSPTPDFALDFIRRLLGDVTGYRVLPFEQTSPLPFIEPTFVLALTAGIILCLPLSNWLQRILALFLNKANTRNIWLQAVFDIGLVFIFILALTVLAGAKYQPAIYGNF